MKRAVLATFAVLAAALHADYAPEKWNLEAREKFAGQRFGIFIHWGLYACYAHDLRHNYPEGRQGISDG